MRLSAKEMAILSGDATGTVCTEVTLAAQTAADAAKDSTASTHAREFLAVMMFP
jgi:hypothetical protein